MRDRSARSGKKTGTVIVLFTICLLAGGIAYRQRSASRIQSFRQSRILLDTVVEMILHDSNETQAGEAMDAAYAEMQRVEDVLSKYRKGSRIFLVNQQAGSQPVAVGPETSGILQRSQAYSQETGGLFDIRIGALVDLWGIGTETQQVPDDEELREVLAQIESAQLEIRATGEVFLDNPQASIDLGGIAKGYSIDRAIAVLKQHGITSALLNAGGDIRCIGTKSDGSAWRIGVKHPREDGVLAVVELEDAAVATSGDYERFFTRNGKRYHHLLDPRNGRPAGDCRSVTILAPSAEQADVVATAVFIMGPERGLEFIEKDTDIEGMIVDAHGEIVKSSGFSFQPK